MLDTAQQTATRPVQAPGADDLLVLVHGMAANAAVWDPLRGWMASRWPGQCLAPDLSGHGRQAWSPTYGFGLWAAELARLISAQSRPGGQVWVMGHSLGGVLGALLASGWFGVNVVAVLALSVKTIWTAEDFALMAKLARAPLRRFDTHEEAAQRYLRGAGLAGLVEADSPMAQAGVARDESVGEHPTPGAATYRLACDPAIYGASAPGLRALLRTAAIPVAHAVGDQDRIASPDDLKTLDPALSLLPGLGHNLHVQAPAAVWQVFESRCVNGR